MSEREELAEVIEAHAETTVDMGTPRKYTGHGGWNISCQCGHLYGSQEDLDAGYSAHIAEAVLVWLRAHDDHIRAEALEQAAEQFGEHQRKLTRRDAAVHPYSEACAWLRARASALRVAAGTPTHHTTEEDADE